MDICRIVAWFHGGLVIVNALAFALSVHIAILQAQWNGGPCEHNPASFVFVPTTSFVATLSMLLIIFSYVGLMASASILFVSVMRLWYGWFSRTASHMARYGWLVLEACLAILHLSLR
jgi:hypothetical protein